MRYFIALLAGSLFGAGLYLSGMTDTTKVQGWLDVMVNWDPPLPFVMGGAIVPMAIAWRLTRVAQRPVSGGSFPAPPRPEIDRRLIIGSTLFGMGWALSGLCPGPAIASISFGGLSGIVFLIAMLAGMGLAPQIKARLDSMVAAE